MPEQNLVNEEAVIEALTLTCEVNEYGTKKYRNKEGRYHRIHGPAIEYAEGSQIWYKDGMLHREDGPASTWSDGSEYYYINNIQLTKNQFIQWQKDNGITSNE